MIGRHACLHTENIHGGDILFPNEHTLNRLTTPPIEHMLNGYDDSALNGVECQPFNILRLLLDNLFSRKTNIKNAEHQRLGQVRGEGKMASMKFFS